MKIYYVVEECVLDSDSESPSVSIFRTEDEAKKYFETAVQNAKHDGKSFTESDEDISEDEYSVYDCGRYIENHITIKKGVQEI